MSHWKIEFSELEFGDTIGEGSFGEVYKGKYLGSPAAIKKLYFVDDEFMQKYIEREMETLTSLHHPNIVQLLGICIHGDDVYIVTEYVAGGNLRKRLKREDTSAMSWKLKVSIAKGLALAMTYLHSKKIIHRDLKSHNVLLDGEGRVKLCDFGLARRATPSAGAPQMMTLVGTDDWMAPEVAGGNDYDQSCDVFSFGMVLYEILSRRKPPERQLINQFAFIPEAVKDHIPRDAPKGLWEMMCECASFESSKRPNFVDIVKKLEDIERVLGPADSPGAKKKKPSVGATAGAKKKVGPKKKKVGAKVKKPPVDAGRKPTAPVAKKKPPPVGPRKQPVPVKKPPVPPKKTTKN